MYALLRREIEHLETGVQAIIDIRNLSVDFFTIVNSLSELRSDNSKFVTANTSVSVVGMGKLMEMLSNIVSQDQYG